MDCEKCCGTCKWHRCVQSLTKYTCCKESSSHYTDLTDECHVCGEWEAHDNPELLSKEE